MRTTKFAALVAAVALLVVGATFAAFAADPTWVPTGDQWEAYDKDGNQIFSDWATSNGGWYYLGDDGYMVKDALIEDGDNTYYVDENGLMVTASWKKVVDDDYADEENDYPNYRWFYFQANGKAYKSAMKDCPTAAGTKRFAFADDGTMLWGWIDKTNYTMSTADDAYESLIYFGNGPEDGHLCKDEWIQWDIDGEETLKWFYFSASNYKKAIGDKTIKGVKYTFDSTGIMLTSWATDVTVSVEGGKINSFYDENGQKIVKGWFYTYDPNDDEADDDEKMYWFYADSKNTIAKNKVVVDGGKFYVVDENGHLISGLAQIEFDSDWNIVAINRRFADGIDEDNVEYVLNPGCSDDYEGLYYLNEEHDGTFGCMKSGSQKIGDYTLYFKKANTVKKGMGKAYNGLDGNYFYQNGEKVTGDAAENKYWTTDDIEVTYISKKLKAEAITSDRIELVEVEAGDANVGQPLFTASGAFVKSLTNKKDSNDLYICVDNYKITHVGENKK